MWNVVLNSLELNILRQSKNNPTKSGQYICTCIDKISDNNYYRYLRVMQFNVDSNCWHDIGNEYGISHKILAWKEQEVCDFNDFKYESGVLYKS